MSAALEITLPYSDLTEFVARFRGIAREGIALPSPFSRKVGETIQFVVRVMDRTIVLEGSGEVMDVADNGRGSPPDARYDLAIVFNHLTPTSDVIVDRLVLAQEYDNTEPTGMRKAPPEPARRAPAPTPVRSHSVTPPPPARSSAPPPRPAPPPLSSSPRPPVVRERIPDGDLLEEIDEEDMLTPPPRVLPLSPEPPRPARTSAPPPLRASPASRAPMRPSSPPARPSSPPARSSMTPLPPPPASLRTPTARPAPTRRRTAPGTGEIVAPDMVIATEIDRVPTFDTQTDARKHAAAPPAPTRTPGRVPVPTRAAPAPRTTGGFPAPPPRRKTGQRKAVETPTDPDVVVKAPPRRKTLSGAGSAPTRRKTGTGRAVAEGQTAPTAPRRKTGQRRAVEPPADDQTQRTRADQTQRTRADQTQRTRADQTQRTRAPTRGSDDEDLDS